MKSSRLWSVLGVSVLVAACHASSATAPAGEPADRIDVPADVLPRHGTLLLGDMHGTTEIPRFVATLVASVAAREPVVLGLEIEASAVPSLDRFLASDGSPTARIAALRDPWWQTAYQDGRQSSAMFDLIDSVRRLRARGARVDIAAFDHIDHDRTPDLEAGQERDSAMARDLIAVRAAHPDAALIVYAGNLHVIRKGVDFAPGYQWMAMQLARAGLAFVTLDVRFASGESWSCSDDKPEHCGVKPLRGRGNERGFRLAPSQDGNYDGWFGVGPLTASPPAALTGKS